MILETRAPLWLTLGLLAAGTTGCWGLTGLEQLEYQDCLTDSDCGPESSGRQCVAGRCVPSTIAASGAGSGGGAVVPNGSGGGGAGAPSGSGGSAGAAPSPKCGSNTECVDLYSGDPYLCKDQRCVGLIAEDCPRVLGLGDGMKNLTQGDPIVLGGYYGGSGDYTLATYNYELAVNEFNEASLGGLPGGRDGKLRPVLMVVCRADPFASDASIQHLFTTLEVPGIVALLTPADLNRVFNLADGRVLFINPGASTTARANTNQDYLLWHILGSPEDLAPPMAALLQRTEAYLTTQRVYTRPLTVTLVDSDYPTLTLATEALWQGLRFNGMNAVDNQAYGFLRRVGTQSSLVHSVGDAMGALDELKQHPPDIILGMATEEFAAQAIPQLELDWTEVAPGQARPFYLLSPMLFGSTKLSEIIWWQLENRTVGLNYARYWDRGLYADYVSRFGQAYPLLPSVYKEGENLYDAPYYLLYSVVAATAQPGFTGASLAQGFLRVIDAQAPPVDIGPMPLSNEIDPLRSSTDYRIQLIGTMGPPSFDLASGARSTPISAWCLKGGKPLAYLPDVLQYNLGSGELDGEFPCFPGF